MCGIFGYSGPDNASSKIFEGLKRLDYRGYDSWGVALIPSDSSKHEIEVVKEVGAIGDLDTIHSMPEAHIGIGHTRWATHGGVTNANAHPHYSSDKSFVLAQNGIVENFQELKSLLEKEGYTFRSQTDTEVIVRLIELEMRTCPDLEKAVISAFKKLKGRNTIVVMSYKDNSLIAIRNGSPLIVGYNQEFSEYYIASDTLSFLPFTNKAIFVYDNQAVFLKNNNLEIIDLETERNVDYEIELLDESVANITLEGFDYYMLKEIIEQQHTIKEAVSYSEDQLEEFVEAIKSSKNVYTIGAGTASYAAGQFAYYLRKFATIDAKELMSYEVDSYKDIFSNEDLLIILSQSGETADSIEAMEFAKSKGVKIASFVNMQSSTISRESDFSFMLRSGPEICVASTKAFTAKLALSLLVTGTVIGKNREFKSKIIDAASKLGNLFEETNLKVYHEVVDILKHKEHFFVLGRGQNYFIAKEAALKIKEISYKHVEGFSGGELKHGVIALIEEGTPVFMISSNDDQKENMLSATAEVKARGALVIGVGQFDNELYDYYLPTVETDGIDSLVNVVPFQLLAYYLTLELGFNPDKPRNLAKSVTVK